MEAIEAILGRRSIRRYYGRPVTEDQIEQILRAAMCAPSANNEQPWQFIVITDRRMLDRIPTVHPYSAMLKEAPLAILVCGDVSLDKSPGYWVVDCAAATQNLLVAAYALGLGTVWLGVYPREERMGDIAALFGLPDHVKPLALVAVGHPAEKKPANDRYDASRVRRNTW
ncbi:MAG: nitroreductase family protein [candidate division Zixibacteria bacterium]|nr:nitroreductase family protein [candidate division Zixibacteria bacterium]